MSNIDKNKVMIDYLCTCPTVASSPLFFNFGKSKENNSQFIKIADNESMTTKFIDGSVLKSYRFILLNFKTISYNAIVKTGTYPDENMEEVAEFQEVIDWIKNQEELRNYPNFGTDCIIDSITTSSANPVLEDVDDDSDPAIATYSVTIQVDYLDNSKKLWK